MGEEDGWEEDIGFFWEGALPLGPGGPGDQLHRGDQECHLCHHVQEDLSVVPSTHILHYTAQRRTVGEKAEGSSGNSSRER